MIPKKTKTLIIGGGITGLMMANSIKTENFVIIEKESEVGGYCKTFKRNGFIWDYAGHFFHFNSLEMKNFFKQLFNDCDFVRCKKNTKIFYRNRLIDYPFQKNIHQLDKDEFIDCLYDLYFRDEKDYYSDFQDMLYGKFGESITKKFLKPYNEKLYACKLNNLDTNAMGRFFPNASLSEILNNMKHPQNSSYNEEFLYPREGAQIFIDMLRKNLFNDNVYVESEMIAVNTKEQIAIIRNKGKMVEMEYDVLVNTIPFHRFLQCLDNAEMNLLGRELGYNKVLVFNIGFDADAQSLSDVHWIYFPDKDINFYRVGFYNNILGMNQMSIYVEIGYSKNDVIDIPTEFATTIKNLKKVGIIQSHKVVDYEALVMNPAYVYINELQNAQIKQAMENLNQQKIYSIGRYGGWKYCSMEDSMLDAINLSKSIDFTTVLDDK